jgi:hypothetical protein
MPSIPVSVVITPSIGQAEPVKRFTDKSQAISRVYIRDMPAGIIAGWKVITVLNEINIVSEFGQTQDIL